MHTAEFDNDGVVWFTPTPIKPPDLRKLQGAMFIDRPDLWPTVKRRTRSQIPIGPGQMALPIEEQKGAEQ